MSSHFEAPFKKHSQWEDGGVGDQKKVRTLSAVLILDMSLGRLLYLVLIGGVRVTGGC